MAFKQNDSPLYFRAARHEHAGEFESAAKIWAKANRAARNPLNQTWSENRSDFCIMQNIREKREAVADGL